VGENERKEIHRIFDSGRGGRTLVGATMTISHSTQEKRLVAAEMNQPRIRDGRKDIEEFVPNALLTVPIIGPKAVLNGIIASSNANAYQVVEFTIRKTFDVQIDRRSVELQIGQIDNMYFFLTDCKRPQRVVKFLLLVSVSPTATRAKCVRQLSNGEYALAV
jgi:hypothetical protein